jgi:putative phosphoesterase
MKIAAIYDIHGNLPALEAVLAAIAEEGVDQIVVGGDLVPGPMASGCFAALRAVAPQTQYIRGNGEQAVLLASRGEELTRVPSPFHPAVEWVAGRLSRVELAECARWPLTLQFDVPGLGSVVFCHATPRDENEIFTRNTPAERLREVFDPSGADVVVCGHTHMQFDRSIGAVRVVNAGSVGMPFGQPGAYWLLLGPEGLELRRTEYDLEAAVDRIRRAGYPADFEVLRPPSEAEMTERFEAVALKGSA